METVSLKNEVYSRFPLHPQALRGKLVFGNIEQIKALRKYEQQIAEFDDPEMREWIVDISVSYDERVRVFAISEEEAVEKASREFEYDALDVDYNANVATRKSGTMILGAG